VRGIYGAHMFWYTPRADRPSMMIAQATRVLVGGDELTWSYGAEYLLPDFMGAGLNATYPGSVQRCRCRAPQACPFGRWFRV